MRNETGEPQFITKLQNHIRATAIACREWGREFLGCEMGEREFDGGVKRLSYSVEAPFLTIKKKRV
jgi:hypothetical protein